MKPVRVLVADDHGVVREGLVALIEADGACVVVAQAADGVEAVERAQASRPDVAIIDIGMPRLNGLEVVRRLRATLPETAVLVLTHHDEAEYVLALVQAGATGYLVKDTAGAELRNAVRKLAAGQGYLGPQAAKALAAAHQKPGRRLEDPYGDLSPREREVMHLMCDGRTTKEIARTLDIGVKTAENHRGRVLAKLGVGNAAELVRYAARRGLVE
ncbi:MAG: response regulator transcription factor [Gammaproteobacteria bacterium]